MPEAIPGRSMSSSPTGAVSRAGGLNQGIQGVGSATKPFLRVVSGAELDQQERDANAMRAGTENRNLQPVPDIANYIRGLWTIFRNHRNQGDDPMNQRLLRSQRMFNGKYDPDKLAAIRRFGGSEVYSRLIAVKCRGASSLLRDVYLGPDRPWDIQPQPDPPVPPEIKATIMQLVSTEVQMAQAQTSAPPMPGAPPPSPPPNPDQIKTRLMGLMHAAQEAALQQAAAQAKAAADKIEDILVQGNFYKALADFITDLPLFSFAVIKGPVVRMVPQLVWVNGKATMQTKARMFWERVSPFDFYWTPGVSNIIDADTLQRHRFTRKELNDLLGVPGYDEAAIRGVLQDYANGMREWLDSTDAEQAVNENREDPSWNRSKLIEGLEFNGFLQGRMLVDYGMDPALIPDMDRDYRVQAWIIRNYVIKVQVTPSPRQRHNYFVTSFEKVPGTVAGHGLPDILEDFQEICNATLRSLVNNMSISSGPQVVINDDTIAPGENSDDLFPWRRWHVQGVSFGSSQKPIDFFQPGSNAQELLSVYMAMSAQADEVSAIPKYVTGSGSQLGGAGRTASGLSMLMGNAEKVLQTVASNVDNDVMQPLMSELYDMIMLTDDTGMLTGQEEIRVRGVNVAVQKETERQKQLQFLQITANPIDAPIVGPVGRARVLRAVAQGLGLPDNVVPDDDTLQKMVQAQKMAAAQAPPVGPDGKPAPTPASQAQGSQAPQPGPAQHSDNAPPVNAMQQGLPYHAS